MKKDLDIKEYISNITNDNNSFYKSIIFNLNNPEDMNAVCDLFKDNKVFNVVNDYISQLEELFFVNNPTLLFKKDQSKKFFKEYMDLFSEDEVNYLDGRWVYYPWLYTIVHILKEEDFFNLRTSRNKLLLSEEEQKKFYNSYIGIAGLSVGNSISLSLILQGGAKYIKLADFDSLELSNLNRIRTGINNLGLSKVIITAREIYTINPYAHVEIYKNGITEKNVEDFTKDLDVLIDEIDSLDIKFLLREYAKKFRIPVVMAADVANNSVLFIERYDFKEQPEYFHGHLGDVKRSSLKNLTKKELGFLIGQQIGIENHTENMIYSIKKIGEEIVSWPQLAGATFLNASIVPYCIKRIVNKQELVQGRFLFSIDEKLIPEYFSVDSVKKRELVIKNFKSYLGI